MDLEAILNLLKDYDLPTIIAGIIVYVHINRKLNTVDKAVNNRAPEDMTLSQEVSEIHRKVDLNAATTSRNIEYIKKEIDAHRDIDEKTFVDLAKDIKKIHKKLNNIGTI
tara:strand:+ start:1494 stop:1823 length:330 start_codon:yes stop_codon:yes gene_type:complete